MIKSLVLAAATAAGAITVGNADAAVSWSIGINTPVVGTLVSGGPAYDAPPYRRVYAPAPVYAPVVTAPVPVYGPVVTAPVPVYRAGYDAPPVYYRPVPVVYPRYDWRWRHGHRYGWR